jgi:hypothetical protein
MKRVAIHALHRTFLEWANQGLRLAENIALTVGARKDDVKERRPVHRWESNRRSEVKGIT